MILPIITIPNPLLKKITHNIDLKKVSKKEIKKLANDMTETMYATDGVGIAAPQVGSSLRVCVIIKKHAPDGEKDLVLINPKWEKLSNQKIWDEEGCLSVPGIYGKVRRYKKIRVSALDVEGNPIKFEATDFFARIVQHEIDHLDGILFIEKAKDLYNVKDKHKI